jgi:pilus assembly protein Flp/PilA
MLKTFAALTTDERAASALEYGLVCALVALVIVSGLGLAGNMLNKLFCLIGSEVSNVTPSA